jgi:hypothetical protein
MRATMLLLGFATFASAVTHSGYVVYEYSDATCSTKTKEYKESTDGAGLDDAAVTAINTQLNSDLGFCDTDDQIGYKCLDENILGVRLEAGATCTSGKDMYLTLDECNKISDTVSLKMVSLQGCAAKKYGFLLYTYGDASCTASLKTGEYKEATNDETIGTQLNSATGVCDSTASTGYMCMASTILGVRVNGGTTCSATGDKVEDHYLLLNQCNTYYNEESKTSTSFKLVGLKGCTDKSTSTYYAQIGRYDPTCATKLETYSVGTSDTAVGTRLEGTGECLNGETEQLMCGSSSKHIKLKSFAANGCTGAENFELDLKVGANGEKKTIGGEEHCFKLETSFGCTDPIPATKADGTSTAGMTKAQAIAQNLIAAPAKYGDTGTGTETAKAKTDAVAAATGTAAGTAGSSGSSSDNKPCFGRDTYAVGANGEPVAMASLRSGDYVMDGPNSYTRVIVNQHAAVSVKSSLLRIGTEGASTLSITPDHVLAVDGKFVPARNVEVGSKLSEHEVVSIAHTTGAIINPLTASGKVLTQGGILSSTYPEWIAEYMLSSAFFPLPFSVSNMLSYLFPEATQNYYDAVLEDFVTRHHPAAIPKAALPVAFILGDIAVSAGFVWFNLASAKGFYAFAAIACTAAAIKKMKK